MYLRLLTVASLVTAVGCSGQVDHFGDGGGDDAGSNVAYALVLEGPDTSVGVGAVVPIAAVLTDASGAPVVGATVTFGFEGEGLGASIRELEVTTDAEGRAETRVTVPRLTSTFYVRAMSPGVASATRSIRVDPTATGAVEVQVSYAGSRTLGETLVTIVPGGACDEPATLNAQGTPNALWPIGTVSDSLDLVPAGGYVAVIVHARGVVGGVVARGCVEDVLVTTGADEVVTVTIEDLPELSTTPLVGALVIEGGPLGVWLAEIAGQAMSALVAEAGGDGGMLYAALEAQLRAEGRGTEADEVAALATPPAIGALNAELESVSAGPSVSAYALSSILATQGGALRLDGALIFPLLGQPAFTIDAVSLVVGGGLVLPGTSLELVGHEVEMPGALVGGPPGYQLAGATLPFDCDDVGALMLAAIVGTYDESVPAAVTSTLGVDVLLAAPALAGYCVGACVEGLRARLLVALLARAREAFTAATETHTTLSLAARVALSDASGDALTDTAHVEAGEAVWSSEGGEGPVSTTFSLDVTSLTP